MVLRRNRYHCCFVSSISLRLVTILPAASEFTLMTGFIVGLVLGIAIVVLWQDRSEIKTWYKSR